MEARILIVCGFLLSSKGVAVAAFEVNVPNEIIAVKGGTAVFQISYTLGSGEAFGSVKLEKGIQKVFEAPAVHGLALVQNGSFSKAFYAHRASTNYYYGRTRFTISLSQVTTSDGGEYTIKMTKPGDVAVDPVVTRLVVDVIPGTPSISGAPTESDPGGARPTVLQCKANLGKPQASMVWSRRIGNAAYTNITKNVTMNTASNNDGTTNGTSTLTVNWETGVQYRCQVSNRQATKSAETEVVKDTGTVKPTGSGEGGDTVKPTGNGEGGDTIKPTENGGSGAPAGCDNIPSKVILDAAFVEMAIISTNIYM